MNSFLFDNQLSYSKYYDCSARSPEEWSERTGHKGPYLGAYFLVTGIIYELLYLPCIYVIIKKELYKMSCYKIMLCLGVCDLVCIAVNSIVNGYLSIIGAVFCTYPRFIYVTGSVAVAAWCATCCTCVILAFNRCCEMSRSHTLKELFSGRHCYMFIAAIIVYFIYFFLFTPPLIFNSNYYAWFFDPMIRENMSPIYANYPHTTNNLCVVVLNTSLYSYLCYCVFVRSKTEETTNSNFQKRIFIQSAAICLFNAIAAYIYIYMQFFPTPSWVILMGQLAWQTSHGSGVIIYLTLNRTIRREVLKMLLPRSLMGRIGLPASSLAQGGLTIGTLETNAVGGKIHITTY